MNRRGFLGGLLALGSGLLVPPALVVPERRYWSLNRTQIAPPADIWPSDALTSIIHAARLVREYEPIMPALVGRGGLRWNEVSFYKEATYTITDWTEVDTRTVQPVYEGGELVEVIDLSKTVHWERGGMVFHNAQMTEAEWRGRFG